MPWLCANLRIPRTVVAHGLVWETNETLLVEAADRREHHSWLRCGIRSGDCELAAGLGGESGGTVPTR